MGYAHPGPGLLVTVGYHLALLWKAVLGRPFPVPPHPLASPPAPKLCFLEPPAPRPPSRLLSQGLEAGTGNLCHHPYLSSQGIGAGGGPTDPPSKGCTGRARGGGGACGPAGGAGTRPSSACTVLRWPRSWAWALITAGLGFHGVRGRQSGQCGGSADPCVSLAAHGGCQTPTPPGPRRCYVLIGAGTRINQSCESPGSWVPRQSAPGGS